MTQSAVSSLKLLTEILQLIKAAADMQWKNITLPPFLLLFLSGSPPPLPHLTII